MTIHVASGTGTGPTKLSAFDSALHAAGVENYNLIRLSSIVPAGTKIENGSNPVKKAPGKWGDRLYVVMADMRVDTPNAEAWAGIGWVQDKKTGKGLFVEHEGGSERSVRSDIHQSLNALMRTRKVDWGSIHENIVGTTCEHEPVCALVIAVYEAAGWKEDKKVRLTKAFINSNSN
jgi:arginine decarboxylase